MRTCTVSDTLKSFDAYLARRGRATRTREKYTYFLRRLERWAGERDVGSIASREIELDYLGDWYSTFESAHGRPPSANTVRHHIAALKSYYAFLERFDFIDGRNPMRQIDAPRVERKSNDWLNSKEDDALLRAARTPQERILVYLLRFSGLRIGEATSLLNEDVDTVAESITVRKSKTPSGRRAVPMLPELRPEILAWQRYQRTRLLFDPRLPFLATSNGTPMWPQYAWRVVKRVAKKAGIRQVSPHTLRRTFGSDLLNGGVRLEVVSKALGHASTTITEQSYAELLDATLVSEVLLARASRTLRPVADRLA
jgi:integrase/recombinase XerD